MLRALLLPLILCASYAWSQGSDSLVTSAELEAAVADVTANLAVDDPQREKLLKLYGDTRAAIFSITEFNVARNNYVRARKGAAKEAADIDAGLAERQVGSVVSLANASLPELEQRMQVSRAELDARKSDLADAESQISGMPERSAEIRSRLTELGTLVPDMQSRLALLPKTVEAGSLEQATLWRAEAEAASAVAEKAALDEELISQPMRLQLLTANQDRASYDIRDLERQYQAMERQAGKLRQGAATQAQAEAEKVLASAVGKHPLVQQLADDNAELSTSFSERGLAIEQTRQREQITGNEAEALESDLNAIEHKLVVLGMSAAVGHILREQQVRLPTQRELKADMAPVASAVNDSSVRQLELSDERRKLLDPGRYVDGLLVGLDEETVELIRPDLLQLTRMRRDLVKQALALESLYATALANVEYNLHRRAVVINDYRLFIQELLLWIPSRDPFSLFRMNGLPAQLGDLFDARPWLQEITELPQGLLENPLPAVSLLLVLVLVYRSRSIRSRIVASGRNVGFVRTDKYSSTLLALAWSVVLSIKWPLLMWSCGKLFGLQGTHSELAMSLDVALTHGALYYWGLEFLRMVMMERGLVAAHFRWPAQRAALTYRHIVLLEQTFLPMTLLALFALSLYPREVGGPLGAIAVILLLLSMAYFFRRLPEYLQGRVGAILTDRAYRERSPLRPIMQQLLIWVPVAAIVAVVFGYVYTAVVFSLLLTKTAFVCALIFLFNELAMRWLKLTRWRLIARAREEAAHAEPDETEISPEYEALENDPELLNDEGTKLINLLTLLGLLVGVLAIWAEVLPALNILDSVQLWHQSAVVDGREVPVPVTLGDLVVASVIAVLGWIVLQRIPGLLEILLRQKMGVGAASAYAATRVFQYTATGALVAGVISSMGGSWSQIQWAVAALSVGIGFGLQEIVANFISGLIILFEQPIRVGDTVTVGGVSGKVTKIRIRATTIRDFDRRELLVPNKEFITQQLLNWSLSDQVTRSTVEVGVAYGTDLDKALAVVREAAHQHPVILDTPEPLVTFEQFGDNSLLIKVRFFLDQVETRLITSSELMLDINRRLNKAGIVVAFPQRDVHLDTSAPLEIRMMEQESRTDQPSGK